MTSLSFLPRSKKNYKKNNKEKKDDFFLNNNVTDFKAFNSALFISEFQGTEENLSENTNKENKKENINTNQDLKLTFSYEKCLTNELLNTIVNDSSTTKKDKNLIKQNIENNNTTNTENKINSENNLKIIKKLFNQPDIPTTEKNVKNKTTIYEENVNGFEYQLKFIENSVNNILPKSYKKSSYKSSNNNNYSNNNNNKYNQRISSVNSYNKFNIVNTIDSYEDAITPFYKNETNYNYNCNNYLFFSPFESNYVNNNDINNSTIYNNKKMKYQVHKLKVCDNNYYGWKCNKCCYFNRGYNKLCVNCRNNRKDNF